MRDYVKAPPIFSSIFRLFMLWMTDIIMEQTGNRLSSQYLGRWTTKETSKRWKTNGKERPNWDPPIFPYFFHFLPNPRQFSSSSTNNDLFPYSSFPTSSAKQSDIILVHALIWRSFPLAGRERLKKFGNLTHLMTFNHEQSVFEDSSRICRNILCQRRDTNEARLFHVDFR